MLINKIIFFYLIFIFNIIQITIIENFKQLSKSNHNIIKIHINFNCNIVRQS